MSRWSSFKSQQILTENWRKFLQEEEEEPEDDESEEEAQVVYGLTSNDNPDSLKRLLSGVVEDDVAAKIINFIASAADDEDVMLEAVSLQGSKSEQDRVFSGETTREILQGLVSLNLGAANLKNVVKVLNQWGKLNTVKFEKPAAASAPAASPAPTAAPDESPESETPPETPTLAPDSEPDDYEEEPTEEIPRTAAPESTDDEEDTRSIDPEPFSLYDEEGDLDAFERFFDSPDNYDELVGTDTNGKQITSGGVFEAIGEALTGIDYIERKYSDYQIVKEFVTKSKSMFNQAGDLYDDGEYLDAIKKLYELGNYVADEYERPDGAIKVLRESLGPKDQRKLNQAIRKIVPYDIPGGD